MTQPLSLRACLVILGINALCVGGVIGWIVRGAF